MAPLAPSNLLAVHVTTVHARRDSRIHVKEVGSLRERWGDRILAVVADGLGDDAESAVRDLGALPRSRIGRAFAGSMRVFRAMQQLQPQIVHFHDPELIPVAMLLRLTGRRIIYDVHEDLPRQVLAKHWIPWILRWPVGRAAALLEWMAGQSFAGVVAATPVIAARFPSSRTALVQNFPVLSEWSSAGDCPHGQREPVFVYVGGIAEIRGAREMVKALAVMSADSRARLELAGPESPPGLVNELVGMGPRRRIVHHGVLSRAGVSSLLGRARAGLVVLQPLRNYVEAQPIKLYEYMAAGLPVIASDFPLWRQIVGGADCGLLVDPMDPGAIGNAMQWILDHPVEAQAMGSRGRQAVERQYNWEHEALELRRLYEAVLMSDDAVGGAGP